MRSTPRIDESLRWVLFLALVVSTCVVAGFLWPEAPTSPRYAGAGHRTPVRGGTFVFHHESDVRGFDPAISFDELSNMGLKLLFEGLLDYDDHANIIPRLATDLPEQSEDGKTFIFHLRHGVRFHNGRELVAEDVRWSMEHMLDPALGSPGSTFYELIDGIDEYRAHHNPHIRGIRVVDRYTVSFTLTRPDQTFLNAMAMTFAYPVPRENYAAHPDDVARHPVGTGAYTLESWEPGLRVIFRRNPHFFIPGQPYPDRMVFELNLTRDPAFMRFRNGELDAVHRMNPSDYLFIKSAREWAPYREEEPKVNLWGLVMNVQLEPFTNVHIRRAVAFAINGPRWRLARANRLLLTGQPIPRGLLGFDENLPGRHHYDLALAREEMRLAGHPVRRGPNGTWIAEGLTAPITLWLGEGNTGKAYGELAQHDLAQIGLRIELKPVAFPIFLQETGKPRTAQMVFTGWSQDFPDPADFLDILFHSRAIRDHDSENRSFYSNPELDQILDQARVERDRARRHDMYRHASEIVVRDAPWAFIWSDLWMNAWQPYVRNFHMNPVFDNMYRDVWLDLPRRRIAMHLDRYGIAERMAALMPFWRHR